MLWYYAHKHIWTWSSSSEKEGDIIKDLLDQKNETKRFIVDIKFIDLLPTSTNCNKDDLSVPNMIIYVTLSSFSPCHKRKLTKGFITSFIFIDEMMVVSYVQIDETKRNFMCKKLIVMQYFFIFHISSNVLLIIKPAQFPQKILVSCKIPIKIFWLCKSENNRK